MKCYSLILALICVLHSACAGPSENYARCLGKEAQSYDAGVFWSETADLDDLLDQDRQEKETVPKNGNKVKQVEPWPDGVIPYRISAKIREAKLAKKLRCAFPFFHNQTCIRFVPYFQAKHQNYLFFDANENKSCESSSLGMAGGKQVINLPIPIDLAEDEDSCWSFGKIIHEIMHALGFPHEQSRNDRDKYVKIHWKHVGAFGSQFKKLNEIGYEMEDIGDYDYSSVMHYKRFLFQYDHAVMTAKKGPVEENNNLMGNREEPSPEDIRKLNLLYKCPSRPEPKPKTAPKRRIRPNEEIQIFLMGGWPNNANMTLEKYVPESREFELIYRARRSRRQEHVVVSVGQEIYIAGGYSKRKRDWGSVEIFDTNFMEWTKGPTMIKNRENAAGAAVYSSNMFICGGYDQENDNKEVLETCEYLNTADPQAEWKILESKPLTARAIAAATAIDGYVYLLGGMSSDAKMLNSVERFDTVEQKWKFLATMHKKRIHFAVTLLDRQIFACGGLKSENDCEKYSISENKWTIIAQMTVGRAKFGMVNIYNQLHAMGGEGKDARMSTEVYDPMENQWYTGAQMLQKRYGFQAIVVVAIKARLSNGSWIYTKVDQTTYKNYTETKNITVIMENIGSSYNVLKERKPGFRCRPAEHKCMGGSYCTDSVCECPRGYYPRGSRCLKGVKPGKPCDGLKDVCTDGSYCSHGICECAYGIKNWRCNRKIKPKRVNATCTKRDTCIDSSSCSRGKCRCSKGDKKCIGKENGNYWWNHWLVGQYNSTGDINDNHYSWRSCYHFYNGYDCYLKYVRGQCYVQPCRCREFYKMETGNKASPYRACRRPTDVPILSPGQQCYKGFGECLAPLKCLGGNVVESGRCYDHNCYQGFKCRCPDKLQLVTEEWHLKGDECVSTEVRHCVRPETAQRMSLSHCTAEWNRAMEQNTGEGGFPHSLGIEN